MAGKVTVTPNGAVNVSADERIASAIAGAVLLLDALVRPSRSRVIEGILGAALVERSLTGCCQLYSALGVDTAHNSYFSQRERPRRDAVTRASEDSFPASDPPSWTPVKGSVSNHQPADR